MSTNSDGLVPPPYLTLPTGGTRPINIPHDLLQMLNEFRQRAHFESNIRGSFNLLLDVDTMTAPIAAPLLYPVASEAALKSQYIGTNITDLPTPAAIIDRAVARRNCTDMLDAARSLELEFRPHVKTHKVGRDAKHVSVIVSTMSEAEHLLPYLLDCLGEGKSPNLLYGLPLPPSQVPRLARLGKQLGPGSVSVLIDHAQQLQALKFFTETAGFPADIFIKVDTGYHRAGVQTDGTSFQDIVGLINTDLEPSGNGRLRGFYSHAGHSYGGDSEEAALELLAQEIERSAAAATKAVGDRFLDRRFVLSIGATPTATSVQSLLDTAPASSINPKLQEQVQKLKKIIAEVKRTFTIELHAGVYALLDLQQLVTRAQPRKGIANLGLSILAEVASTYHDRDPPEVLIAAGSLSLGREPCKSYSGWGIVSDWDMSLPKENETGHSGWIVDRVSQEHGILRKESTQATASELQIGQKVKIWPNHACIAGAGFDYYFVVDSSSLEHLRDVVMDVWVRWRGW